ncbi:MAG TPA: pantoate--beta-alanine ligase [Polyangiaceae bacterium]|nr:pantoate--beta-alanine ligase [Polyangiaceae bacterium]
MTAATEPVVLTTVAELRAAADEIRAGGLTVGLVPTMGALHEGHLSLMLEASRHADRVFATIFVNPTQFGPNEDLEKYPRQLPRDLELCTRAGVHNVFAPSREEMYPKGERTRVTVSGLTDHLCGAGRPGHFQGVATIVTKLLSAVGPCVAVFGKKDYQQLKVIERLVRDLMLPAHVVPAAIVRASDGLALSSRNAYLSKSERERALSLSRGLSLASRLHTSGARSVGRLRATVLSELEAASVRVEYVTLAHPETLEPVDDSDELEGPALLALAGYVGNTRLIDNLVLGVDPDPCVPRKEGVQ